jgi:hypothetical protein
VARGPARKSAEDIVDRGDFEMMLTMKMIDCRKGVEWAARTKGQVLKGQVLKGQVLKVQVLKGHFRKEKCKGASAKGQLQRGKCEGEGDTAVAG